MAYAIPQSVAKVIELKLYLSDGATEATGKTVAITINKNNAGFGNIAAGATNASESALGWYYVSLAAADIDTLGPLVVRGTCAGCETVERLFYVVAANIPVDLRAILGTALTETTPGWIAAAVKKLFNIETPLATVASLWAVIGDKMDLADTLKNKVGATGYDRITDSMEALGENAAAIADLPTNTELNTALAGADDATLLAIAGVDAKVDDLPTNTELAAALAGADDATLLAIAGVDAKVDDLPTNSELADAIGGIPAPDNSGILTAISDSEAAIRGADNDTLKTLSDQIDGVGAGFGNGEFPYMPERVTDPGGNPLDGVDTWVNTDPDDPRVGVRCRAYTNGTGLIPKPFMLDAGTYWLWRQLGGYQGQNPVEITVGA